VNTIAMRNKAMSKLLANDTGIPPYRCIADAYRTGTCRISYSWKIAAAMFSAESSLI
jgi:hypothetical protein